MKLKGDYVTNSSSSSFVIMDMDEERIKKIKQFSKHVCKGCIVSPCCHEYCEKRKIVEKELIDFLRGK